MSAVMERRVSNQGRKYIYGIEGGNVKKAYRDAVGVVTIGPGLTAASGVVKPKMGMTITDTEGDRLFDLAVERNYMPRVVKALGAGASQDAIDAGTSFDWNTGAINRASWVASYLAGNKADTRSRLGLWNKGGGKVLPGLTRRREEEADILLLGEFPVSVSARLPPANDTLLASFVISLSPSEKEEIALGFNQIGYYAGTLKGSIRKSAVEDFQRDYDLTVDGKIGRATLSTLQRELDVRSKAGKASLTATTGVATTGAGAAIDVSTPVLSLDPATIPTGEIYLTGGVILAVAAIYGGYLAWQYRDMIAVRVAGKAPRLAAWLRSF